MNDYQADTFRSRAIAMKITHNTVAAILSVLLIATTCTVLLIGGLNIAPVSHDPHGRYDVTASTHH